MPTISLPFFTVLGFLYCGTTSCRGFGGTAATENVDTTLRVLTKSTKVSDTTAPALPAYDSLQYLNVKNLAAASGTKSVLFNADGSRLYAMNLEGMSVYEYDADKKAQTRSFRFKPTRGQGWDYEREKPVPSYEEKPVEACLSKDETLLWVSLHNAGGVVPLPLKDFPPTANGPDSFVRKLVYVHQTAGNTTDSVYVPLVRTGATPKVIARTGNDSFLLVSNWHGLSVSVLQRQPEAPYLKKLTDAKTAAIPRGIAVDDNRQRSYIAIMGSNSIAVLNNATWQEEPAIPVAANPRHVVIDSGGRLFVSFNKLAKVSCVDPVSRTTLFSAATAPQPRSIVLSKNGRFLFVTCYRGNTVGVYKVEGGGFRRLYSLPCKGKPVGIDLRETADTLEAWVCNYVGGNLSVFTFTKR